MKILITGGGGYIGSHAVKLFLKNGHEVVVYDNLKRGYREPLEKLKSYGKLDCVKGDLLDRNKLNELFTDYRLAGAGVLHFAALCLVNESMEQPELYFRNNMCGTLNLLEAMRTHNAKELVFSSTCAVYGESEYLPIDENHPTNPTNPYGESKLMTEKMIQWFGRIHDFNYVILRYFNVCGADSDGEIGDSKKPSQLLMQNAVRGALGIDEFELTCGKVDTPDGTPIRDYIDVEDLVRAHLAAYNHIKNGGQSEIINLGNGSGYSVKEIVSMVEDVCGVKIDSKQGTPRKGEYAKVYADITKANKVLNWKPEKSLEDSVLSLKKWYEGHPNGWQS
ncbi:UDP-glucose 4-epimerase GalE [Candidatus Dojkabacteria bacterium]|nr:UDP-glucose 4-epimerase GalE [Candidatus Dojkabacteria bacterium]